MDSLHYQTYKLPNVSTLPPNGLLSHYEPDILAN